MKKSEATSTKISRGTRRIDWCRIATTSPFGWNSNGNPILRLEATRRRTGLFGRLTIESWSAPFGGRTKAYATTSGESATPGRTSSRSVKPNVKPARAFRRTREKRNPTNPRLAIRVRWKFSMGHCSGRWIRWNVAAISSRRSVAIRPAEFVEGHKPSVVRGFLYRPATPRADGAPVGRADARRRARGLGLHGRDVPRRLRRPRPRRGVRTARVRFRPVPHMGGGVQPVAASCPREPPKAEVGATFGRAPNARVRDG